MKNPIFFSLLGVVLSLALGGCEPKSSDRDAIESRSSESLGQKVDDVWLHGKIVAKLVGNTKTPARNIDVEVNQGVVTLRGVVSDAEEKSAAEKLAQETEGVKTVDNQLEVRS